MALEITHEWDAVIATFEHPRYELYGPGVVFDGEEEVRRYFELSRIPLPDQGHEVIAIAADPETDTVLVEFWLTGTHLGPLNVGGRTIEPTGRAFRLRMAAAFEFCKGSDKIVCERAILRSGRGAEGARPFLTQPVSDQRASGGCSDRGRLRCGLSH